jgi:hypothetical protein
MAATDLGKVGMVMKGAYNSANTYEALDAVSYNAGLYVAKQDVPANTVPTDTTYWQVAISASDLIQPQDFTDSYQSGDTLYDRVKKIIKKVYESAYTKSAQGLLIGGVVGFQYMGIAYGMMNIAIAPGFNNVFKLRVVNTATTPTAYDCNAMYSLTANKLTVYKLDDHTTQEYNNFLS